ncbi:class I SAM-dependent methyltransferase [Buchnera aphidicola]|uniref:class I SAM-dependent methyltransferase n=1 Tax=Buchnera aphidicola TaxID=9 RepID=UPI0020927190|nr:class I SAM-dependent methyltransferase [Buchnera aphidicola]USS94121.1 class I SAM-dependent methyltransferase [Buchnera aphidicola (Sipha maydis)]WII23668.1 class I SAM-dependent methyltransferase [Buchnera aphidicola (Sipha maydis)]
MNKIYKNFKIFLLNINNKLKICKLNLKNKKITFFTINFLSGKNNFRRKYNRKKELIIKAVKIKNSKKTIILDATAGLGKDSFILASSGYKIFMIEKNKIIYQLLKNGLKRLYKNMEINMWIKKKMILFHDDSLNFFKHTKIIPDVIYLDPMFLNKKKTLPKKDMSILKILVSKQKITKNLLKKSIKFTKKKVVVKRPIKAPYLENIKPTYIIYGTKYRFDIYLKN